MIDVLPRKKQKYVFESILTNVGLFFLFLLEKLTSPSIMFFF